MDTTYPHKKKKKKKCRESISCFHPSEHRRGKARIQINVQAIKGCICFCLRAISASCTRTVRQDKPPDRTVKSSKHISHYRLLFTALTLHDTANGFSLSAFFTIFHCHFFFCVLPLIHASCARHILWIIWISWELFNTERENLKWAYSAICGARTKPIPAQ